jgi:micrococcal nuclease
LTETQVERVVDGDTIDVGPGGRIRLIGINTPETVDPRRPVQCFGREASDAAKVLLRGKPVLLEPDPSQDDKDQYGRLLRFVWLADGRFVNFELVVRGYANEYTFRLPYKYQTLFRESEQFARTHNLGLWSPATCAGNTNRAAASPTAARRSYRS